jgi:hypothetical protein
MNLGLGSSKENSIGWSTPAEAAKIAWASCAAFSFGKESEA